MTKPFLTVEQQIDYLEKNKNVTFNNRKQAKRYLLDNNYFNVISTSKIAICSNVISGKHVYDKTTEFSEWQTLYENEREVAFDILKSIYQIENTFNSRLAYYVSKLIHKKQLNDLEYEDIYKYINSTTKNIGNYAGEETWVYITRFMFSESINLFKILKDIQEERRRCNADYKLIQQYRSSIWNHSINDLYEYKNLRNHVSHNTPLNIYLTNHKNMKTFKKRSNILKNIVSDNNIKVVEALLDISQLYISRKVENNV